MEEEVGCVRFHFLHPTSNYQSQSCTLPKTFVLYIIHTLIPCLISAVISRQIQRGVKKGLLANKQSLLQLYNSSRSKISGGILFVPSCTITDWQKNVHWRIITILWHSSLNSCSCLMPDIFTNRVKTACNLAFLEYWLNVINAKAHIRFSLCQLLFQESETLNTVR